MPDDPRASSAHPSLTLIQAATDAAEVMEDIVTSIKAILSDNSRRSAGERTHLSELSRRLADQAVALRRELDMSEPDSKIVASHVETARTTFLGHRMVKAALAVTGVAAAGPVQSESAQAWNDEIKPELVEWVTDAAGQLERLSGTVADEALKSEPLTRETVFAIANKARVNRVSLELANADFGSLDLSGADLSDANLSGGDYTGAKLRGSDLTGADLTNANLSLADCTGAFLAGANLTRANLAGAKLSGADLPGVDITGVNLTQVDFTGVHLTGVDLSQTDLEGVNLDGARWEEHDPPIWPDGFKPPANPPR